LACSGIMQQATEAARPNRASVERREVFMMVLVG
jgi:hypothetical protein